MELSGIGIDKLSALGNHIAPEKQNLNAEDKFAKRRIPVSLRILQN